MPVNRRRSIPGNPMKPPWRRSNRFKEQVRATEVALDGVKQEQLVGARTVLDVLDAELEALNAKVSLVQAQTDLVVAALPGAGSGRPPDGQRSGAQCRSLRPDEALRRCPQQVHRHRAVGRIRRCRPGQGGHRPGRLSMSPQMPCGERLAISHFLRNANKDVTIADIAGSDSVRHDDCLKAIANGSAGRE